LYIENWLQKHDKASSCPPGAAALRQAQPLLSLPARVGLIFAAFREPAAAGLKSHDRRLVGFGGPQAATGEAPVRVVRIDGMF
jgi:hypothetical protein